MRERSAAAGSLHPARGNPWAGSHPSHTAKTTTSIMPAHTTGTAAAVCAATLSSVPRRRSRQTAATTPSGPAMTRATMSDMTPSGIVTCAFWASSAATLEPVRSEVPRSPRSIPPTQSRYWTASGASSPSCARSDATCSGVLFVPAMTCAMSPGSTRSARKMSTLATTSPTARRASRVSVYRITRCSWPAARAAVVR